MDRSVGSPRTRSVVWVRGPGVSVFGLPVTSTVARRTENNKIVNSVNLTSRLHTLIANIKNRYVMHTCVCYLEIQRSLGKEGNARFANEGHLGFVSVTFGFHCGRWKARYVSELFSFS